MEEGTRVVRRRVNRGRCCQGSVKCDWKVFIVTELREVEFEGVGREVAGTGQVIHLAGAFAGYGRGR